MKWLAVLILGNISLFALTYNDNATIVEPIEIDDKPIIDPIETNDRPIMEPMVVKLEVIQPIEELAEGIKDKVASKTKPNKNNNIEVNASAPSTQKEQNITTEQIMAVPEKINIEDKTTNFFDSLNKTSHTPINMEK